MLTLSLHKSENYFRAIVRQNPHAEKETVLKKNANIGCSIFCKCYINGKCMNPFSANSDEHDQKEEGDDNDDGVNEEDEEE